MKPDSKKFIRRIIGFTLPYIAVATFTVVIFYRSGEIFWMRKTLNAQITERRNFIYSSAYTNIPHHFKLAAVEMAKPQVLSLGSSRVLQMRAGFFNDTVSFYSAGGVFKRLEQLRAFLQALPEEALPKTILLAIDPWWFNANYTGGKPTATDMNYDEYILADDLEALFDWQKFYVDWWNGKINLKKIWRNDYKNFAWFGIGARMNHEGYRKDGSRFYGSLLTDKTARINRIRNAVVSAQKNEGIMKWSTEIDKTELNELRLLLRFCDKHKINVTGFLPPVAERVLIQINKMPEHYPHFLQLNNFLYPIFRDYGFRIYDFTKVESFGSNYDEMVDGVHGSEKCNLRLYLQLLRKDIYLNQYSDSTYLKSRLETAKGNFEVFGNH